MADIVFKDESYKIIGYCFEVFNQIGYGHKEVTYQKALEVILKNKGVTFDSQSYAPLKIDNSIIGKYFLDLLIENKIAVELKVGDHFFKRDINQLFSYLKSKNLKLGLMVNFTSNGVKYRRVLNIR